MCIVKNEKVCSRESITGVTRQPFTREIMHVTCGSNQLSEEKGWQLGQKGTEMRKNEGRLSDH